MLGRLDVGREGWGVGGLCDYSRFCYGDWLECGKGMEGVNCVLTSDCVRGIGESVGREGSGGYFVLTSDCVRGIIWRV